MPTIKNPLNPFHENFIRENYLDLSDAEMAEAMKIRPYHIHQFRIENGLVKKGPNDARRFEPGKERLFNVHAVENWIM